MVQTVLNIGTFRKKHVQTLYLMSYKDRRDITQYAKLVDLLGLLKTNTEFKKTEINHNKNALLQDKNVSDFILMAELIDIFNSMKTV